MKPFDPHPFSQGHEEPLLPATSGGGPDQPTAELRATLHGRDVQIRLSARARRALPGQTTPLALEMELYFSCLVRKQLRVRPLATVSDVAPVPIASNLYICFRPVVTQECRMDDLDGEAPPVKTMPVKDARAFVPHWLDVDFRDGNWCGEFGYTR